MDEHIAPKRAIYNSLIFRMSLFVSFVLLFSLTIISVVFMLSERQKILSDIVKSGKVFANSTILKIYNDYVQYYTHPRPEDFENFKQFTQETLKNNEDIIGVSLSAFNGRILFDSEEFTTGKVTTDRDYTDPVLLEMLKSEETTSRNIRINGQDVTEIVVPLPEPGGGAHIISARYLLSNRSLGERMNEIYRQLAIVIIPLLLLVIVLSVIYSIAFTKPIRVLTQAAELVRSGNLEVQTHIQGKDEIGTLASIFDQMIVSIKDSRAQLEAHSKTLERQVADRTHELQEKLDELERTNKLMVGRELKMTEMKKELDELKTKTNPPG